MSSMIVKTISTRYARKCYGLVYSVRNASRTATLPQTQPNADDFSMAKPLSQMSSPPLIPILGSLWRIPFRLHKAKTGYDMLFEDLEKYGPTYYDRNLSTELIMTCDPNVLQRVFAADGKFPQRLIIDLWTAWREERGEEKGILMEKDDEHWRKMRRPIDRHLLRPKVAASYMDDFNEVANDFVARLRRIRKDDLTVSDMDQELFNWSLETIGTVLYETRFGNFSENRDPRNTEFIKAVNDFFMSQYKIQFFSPKFAKRFFRKWYDLHFHSSDIIAARTRSLVDKKVSELEERVAAGEQVSGFLAGLLTSGKLTRREINANVSDLMTAAVDTTSNTMQWAIELLTWHPEIQAVLHEEVSAVLGGSGTMTEQPTFEDIQRMPYLRAVLREVLRLYPAAGFVTKVTKQDLVLDGYAVPKGMKVVGSTMKMARDPKLFAEPERFWPERWLRGGDDAGTHHPFAWLPFSHGPRMCAGRRIAELEMHLLLLKLSQHFTLVPHDKEMRTLNMQPVPVRPNEPVNVKFVDRSV